MLTDKWIEEQLKLCEAASQPPWHDGFDDGSGRIGDRDGAYITLTETVDSEERFPTIIVGGDYEGIPIGVLKQEDVDFIIAAREGYAKVLSAFKALHKETHPVAECPCCGEFYVEKQGDGGLCPECVRMQGAFNG